MKAAVVHSFDSAPIFGDVADALATGPQQAVVQVLAAGLHHRVRSQAAGTHYASSTDLPLVPGVDGVGRTADGRLLYFVLPDTKLGSMAQRTVIDLRRSAELPGDADPVAVAAAMNPVMSSWLALRRRIEFPAGARVLVLGATGSAGRMAVQVARHLGATQVVGAGRDAARLAELPALGADSTVSLLGTPGEVSGRLGDAAADTDVVLDYIWGQPAADAMRALVLARPDRGRPFTWIQIGSLAGTTAPVPSEVLRAADFRILGSGQGSVGTADIIAELPQMAAQISRGAFTVDARSVPLADVEQAWTAPEDSGERIVLVPAP